MDEQYTIYIPKITSATILQKPIGINTSFLITVSAEDQAVVVGAAYFQSGEVYSGEV